MNRQLNAILTYADPDLAVSLLGALGFEEVLVVRDETDRTVVHHAEFAWNELAGVMWATPDPSRVWRRPGAGNAYLAVDSDAEVTDLYRRALAAGCESVQEPEDQDYGGRGAGVRDHEGNLWSFGSYQGAQRS